MRIALLGDVALFGVNTVSDGTYIQRMAVAKTILEKCDYVVANLESPLTNADKVIGGKSAYLKGSPDNVEILKWLGVTHCSLANNHTFDYDERGLLDTISTLEDHGIKWFGANGKSERIEDADGVVALHGYCCYSTNAKGIERKVPFVNVLDPRQMAYDLAADEGMGAYSILSCHWGQEHVHYPNYDHVELIRKLVKGSQATIHGHHPHVIQGIERVGDALVAYSLGNFCFDDVYTSKSDKPLVALSADNKETFILIVEIKDGVLEGYDIVPITFVEGPYVIHEEVFAKLREYSDFLTVDKREYIDTRLSHLSNYLSSRKKLRDVQWYIKRLNIESLRIILGARHNSKRYSNLVKGYLDTKSET